MFNTHIDFNSVLFVSYFGPVYKSHELVKAKVSIEQVGVDQQDMKMKWRQWKRTTQ